MTIVCMLQTVAGSGQKCQDIRGRRGFEEQQVALWLLSDLLESAVVEPLALIEGRQTLLLDAMSTKTDLDGATVHVVGVGRFHDPTRRVLSLDERRALANAWRLFVAHAGGRFDMHGFEDEPWRDPVRR